MRTRCRDGLVFTHFEVFCRGSNEGTSIDNSSDWDSLPRARAPGVRAEPPPSPSSTPDGSPSHIISHWPPNLHHLPPYLHAEPIAPRPPPVRTNRGPDPHPLSPGLHRNPPIPPNRAPQAAHTLHTCPPRVPSTLLLPSLKRRIKRTPRASVPDIRQLDLAPPSLLIPLCPAVQAHGPRLFPSAPHPPFTSHRR